MRRYRATLATLATVSLVMATVGCVEQDSDLHIRGVVEYQGQESSEDIDCEGGGMGMGPTYSKPVLSCNEEIEPGNVSEFLTRATVNINQLDKIGLSSQPTENQDVYSDEQYCDYRSNGASRADFIRTNQRRSDFEITLDIVNKLRDGREIGSEGEGGGGGGFENLRVNVNDVQIETMELSFPNVSAGFGTKEYKFNILADSGGGGAAVEFSLFDSRDQQALRKVHKAAFEQQRDGQWSNNLDAEVRVIAEITVQGETLGERQVDSNIFRWPITFCVRGCGTTSTCEFESQQGG